MNEIGDASNGLILKSNGILLLQIGNRTINMLDNDGNLNIKLKNVVKSQYPDSNSPDGIYCSDGKIWIKSGGSIYQIAVGNLSELSLPKGSMVLYQGTDAPNGWKKCDISTGINGIIYITNDENAEIELYTLRFKWKVNGEQVSNFQAILGKTTEFPVLEMEAFDSEGNQVSPIPFSVNTKYNSTYPRIANISSTNGNIELKAAGLTTIGVRSEENNQHGEAIATYTLKVIEEKDNGEDFDDIIEKFCEIDGIPEISLSGENSDMYKYLKDMYDLANSEYNKNDSILFNDNIYSELEVYNYHGDNKEYYLDGTAKNAMLYWIIAMCLSEIFYTEDTTGSSTNMQTKIFKKAYDLGKENGYGRTIPLYGNYTSKGDVTICRLVASVIYAKNRKNYRSQIYTIKKRFNRSSIIVGDDYEEDNLWANGLNIDRPKIKLNNNVTIVGKGFNPNKIGYAVDVDDIFPSASGPYVTSFTNANGILLSNLNRTSPNTGDIFDNDYNYHIDNLINLEVIGNYNLVNNSNLEKFNRTILAIADDYEGINHYLDDKIYYYYPKTGDDTYPHDTFKEGTNFDSNCKIGYFTGVFNSDVVTSKNLSLYKYTLDFTDLLRYVRDACSTNRYTTLDPLYGRRRPSLENEDPSMYNLGGHAKLNWLDDHSIQFLSGGSTRYDGNAKKYYVELNNIEGMLNEYESSYYLNGTVSANTYPSGHSAGIWGTALILIELLSDMGAKDDEIYNIYKAAYKFTVSRTIVRAHWNSDIIYGKLSATTIFPILHNINNFDEVYYNKAKNALNSSPVNRKIKIYNNTGAPAQITGEVYFFVEDETYGHKTLTAYIERCNGVIVNPYHSNLKSKYYPYTIENGLSILCDLVFDWNPYYNGTPLYEDESNSDTINSPIRIYGIDSTGERSKTAFICSNPTQETLGNYTYVVKLTSRENVSHKIDIAYDSGFNISPEKTGIVNKTLLLPTLYIKENEKVFSNSDTDPNYPKYELWDTLADYLRYRFEVTTNNDHDEDFAEINEETGEVILNELTNGYGDKGRGVRCGVYVLPNSIFSECNAHFYVNIVESDSPPNSDVNVYIINNTGETAYITGEIYFFITDGQTTLTVYAHDERNVANGGDNGKGESLNITTITIPAGATEELRITDWGYQGLSSTPSGTFNFTQHTESSGITENGVRVYAKGTSSHQKYSFVSTLDQNSLNNPFSELGTYTITINKRTDNDNYYYNLMYKPDNPNPIPEPNQNCLYKVGLISDIHYQIPDNEINYISYKENATRSDNGSHYREDLNCIIETFKDKGVSFVASPGDIATHSLGEIIEFTHDYIKDFTGIDTYTGTNFLSNANYKKFYCALGNHDHYVVYSDTSKCKYLNYNNGVNTHDGQRWISVTSNGTTRNCPGILSGNNITYFNSNSKSYRINITENGADDIYIFLSTFYGEHETGVSVSQMHPHNKMSDKLIRKLKEEISKYDETYVFPDNESKLNFLYYKYEDLLELINIIKANTTKRIFVFSHYFLPHKSGGNNEYPKDKSTDIKGGASTCLMGITFHLINSLNNKFKNVIWFSGHSHYSWTYNNTKRGLHWTNKNYEYITPTSEDNSTALRYTNNYYVVGTGNTPYNRLSSKSNGTCGWNVHLSSMSKPIVSSSGSNYSLCEAAIMYVYSNKVEIHKIGYSANINSNNEITHTAYSSIEDQTLEINNDGTGSCNDNAPEINGGGDDLPSSVTNVPNDSMRFVISNNTNRTVLFTGRFKLFFTNEGTEVTASNGVEIDFFFRLPLKLPAVLKEKNGVCIEVTKYDYFDNTDSLDPGQKLVLTYKNPLSSSGSTGLLKVLNFEKYELRKDNKTIYHKLIKSDGSSNGYRFVTKNDPAFDSGYSKYNYSTQYGSFGGNPYAKLQTALWYWTTPDCTSLKLWVKDANPVPCRILFDDNQNTTILLGKLYKLNINDYIDTVKTSSGDSSNGYKKYYVNTTLVSPIAIDDSSFTMQII